MELTTITTVTSRKLSWHRGKAIVHPGEAGALTSDRILEVFVEGLEHHLFYRVRPATQEDVDRADEGLLRLREEEVTPGPVRVSVERWLQTTLLPHARCGGNHETAE